MPFEGQAETCKVQLATKLQMDHMLDNISTHPNRYTCTSTLDHAFDIGELIQTQSVCIGICKLIYNIHINVDVIHMIIYDVFKQMYEIVYMYWHVYIYIYVKPVCGPQTKFFLQLL